MPFVSRSTTTSVARAIVNDMSSAPAAKTLDVDPIEAAFDNAPWEGRPGTEVEIARGREMEAELLASIANGTMVTIPGAVVTAEIAERARRAKCGEPPLYPVDDKRDE